jgi:RimJ/RimL family protein N-acetyltransferase
MPAEEESGMTTAMRERVLAMLRRFKEVGPGPDTTLSLPGGGRLEVVSWADAQRPEATALLARWREKANPFFPSQFPVTLEGTHRWLVKGLLETADRILFWVKTVDARRVGHVGLFRFDFQGKSVEIDNIVRGEEGLAPGLMQAAITALLDWTFDALGCEATSLRVLSDNDRAIRLYRRLGYVEVARVPLVRKQEGPVVHWVEVDAAEGGAAARHFVTMRLPKAAWRARAARDAA